MSDFNLSLRLLLLLSDLLVRPAPEANGGRRHRQRGRSMPSQWSPNPTGSVAPARPCEQLEGAESSFNTIDPPRKESFKAAALNAEQNRKWGALRVSSSGSPEWRSTVGG